MTASQLFIIIVRRKDLCVIRHGLNALEASISEQLENMIAICLYLFSSSRPSRQEAGSVVEN